MFKRTQIHSFIIYLFFALSGGHKITLQPYCISKNDNVCTRGLVSEGDTVLFRGEVDFSDNPSSQFIYFQVFRKCDTKFTYLCLMEIEKDCKHANTSEICNCKMEDVYRVQVNVRIKASQSYTGARIRGTIVRSSDYEEFRSEEQLVPEIHVINHFDIKIIIISLGLAVLSATFFILLWYWNLYRISIQCCYSLAQKIFSRIFPCIDKQDQVANANLLLATNQTVTKQKTKQNKNKKKKLKQKQKKKQKKMLLQICHPLHPTLSKKKDCSQTVTKKTHKKQINKKKPKKNPKYLYIEVDKRTKLIAEEENIQNKDLKQLTIASEKVYTETLKTVIEKGTNAYGEDLALKITVDKLYTETVNILIEKGVNEDVKDLGGMTQLMIASEKGCSNEDIKLIENGAHLGDIDNNGRTPLMIAFENGNTESAINLIEMGANVNDKESTGQTALMIASKNGKTETVITLLDHKANINEETKNKRTALMFASENGHNETVQKLLDYGANLEAKDEKGINALMFALQNGHYGIVKQFIGRNKAILRDKDSDGWTALMLACEKREMDTVSFILDSGVDIDDKNIDGRTALMIATEKGFHELVGLLIKNKASIDVKDKYGICALDLAIEHNYPEIEELLSQYAGSTSIKSPDDFKIQENDEPTKLSSPTPLPEIEENPEYQELAVMSGARIEMEWLNCQKQHGHQGFIPWKNFEHNSKHYCEEAKLTPNKKTLNYIVTMGKLTARLLVKFVSKNRPEVYKKLFERRGKEHIFTGTGCVVYDVNISKHPCRCIKCTKIAKKKDTEPIKTFSVYIATATHVVYDDEEAKKMTAELNYNDDYRKTVKRLYGVSLCERSVNGDSCVVECVTCDEQLAKEIKANFELSNVLYRAFPRSLEPIVVIISHPHGKPKHISFGKCQMSLAERNVLISLTSFQYNASTCPGGSGAPVLLMNDSCSFRGSKFTLPNFPTHSGLTSEGAERKKVSEVKEEHLQRDRFLFPERVEEDVHKNVSFKKRPRHTEFVSVNDFNVSHLPEGCHDNALFEWVKYLADLTVQVAVKMISTERPEFWPNTNQPYPFNEKRGSHVMCLGTGIILLIRQIGDEQQPLCTCHRCQLSETPSKVYCHIYMKTATRVVFDELEACHTTARLFFDRQDSPLVTLDGWSVVDSDVAGDACYLKCATCDVDLADKLIKMTQNLWDTYKTIKDKNKLQNIAIILSHPHGGPKQVSVGHVTEDITLAENYDTTFSKHSYATWTRPGSSGADVIILLKDTPPFIDKFIIHHVHSDALANGLNKCSFAVDKFN